MKIKTKILLIGLILWIVFIAGCTSGGRSDYQYQQSTTSQQTCTDVQVPYTEKVKYTEQEPYTDTEYYQVPLKYTYINEGWSTRGIVSTYTKYSVDLKNIDDVYGAFTLTVNCYTSQGNLKQIDTENLYPENSKHIEMTFDLKCNSLTRSVEPSTKTASKQVTKYRTVTKTREETRYKTERRCS